MTVSMSALSLTYWQRLCLHKRCEVLSFLPHGLVAICKPCGLLSHPNESSVAIARERRSEQAVVRGDYDARQELFRTRIAPQTQESSSGTENKEPLRSHSHISPSHSQLTTHLLHRLDKATSGAMLLSTDRRAAHLVRSLFRRREVRKEYLAVVRGVGLLGGEREALWEDDYRKTRSHNSVRAQAKGQRGSRSVAVADDLVARTSVVVERESRELGLTLLRLRPVTGFSHQLRFQCAIRQCPILGDDVYGDFALNKSQKLKRLFLHSHRIEFDYPVGESDGIIINNGGKERIDVCAPIPESFLGFFKNC